MKILDDLLGWVNRRLNAPAKTRIWGICMGCGGRYDVANKHGRQPGFCSTSCADQHDEWRRG
jgi:hypothetical protein